MSNVTVIVGGQAGSEGKGAICAALHRERKYDWAVRVGGPNAGHTVMLQEHRVVLRQIPVAAVADPDCVLIIAAGSEIDLVVLREEVRMLESLGIDVTRKLIVDVNATVISEADKAREARIGTGTTGKGIGAARASRAMRDARLIRDIGLMGVMTDDTQELLRMAVNYNDDRVLIEGAQGYVLGTHAGYYPHCTSGDCRAVDCLAGVGLGPMETDTWVVLRTYPIRIAGNSGPLENEIEWDRIGVTPEFTTVTRKLRRVGEWNWGWAKASVEANSAPHNRPALAITFTDYLWPGLAGWHGSFQRKTLPDETRAWLYAVEVRLGARVAMIGTGPDTHMFLTDEETGEPSHFETKGTLPT